MKPTVILSESCIENYTGTIAELDNVKKMLSKLTIDDFENIATSITFNADNFDKIFEIQL